MRRSKVEILKEEIVLPEVVMNAAEDAFDKILREASMEKQQKMEVACMKSRKPKFKKRWVALVAVAVLVIGTLSVGAATDFQWLKLVEADIVLEEEDKEIFEKYAMNNKIGQSVEQNGVTITAEGYICDRSCVYIIMSIDGIDEPKDDEFLLITDYEMSVGTSLGSISGRYLGLDEETGKMLYVFTSTNFSQNDIVGRYVNITINGIEHLRPIPADAYENGTAEEYDNVVKTYDGTFEFHWKLENEAPTVEYAVDNVEVADTGIVVQSVSISPLSTLVEATYPKEVIEKSKETGDVDFNLRSGFVGLKMKDGSYEESMGLLTLKGNVGTDEHLHQSVIDLENIEAIVFADPLADNWNVSIEERKVLEIPVSEMKIK